MCVTARTKHFERVMHFLREKVADLFIKMVYVIVNTKHQLADIFTKALDRADFIRLRNAFLVDCEL